MREMEPSYSTNRIAQRKGIKLTGDLEAGGLGLQRIFDHIPGAIIFVNRQGRIENMNRAATALLGELGEQDGSPELRDWPARFGFYLEDGATLYPGDKMPPARALNGEAVEDQEMILRKTGQPEDSWVSMSSMPFAGEDGQVLGAVTLIRDITYRKKVERARERSAGRNEALYKLSELITETGNDLDRLTQRVASLTSQVIGDLSVVSLLDGQSKTLRVAGYEDPEPGRRAQLREAFLEAPEFDAHLSLEGAAVDAGEPVLIPAMLPGSEADLLMPPLRGFMSQHNPQSILVAPLLGRGGTLGTISLIRYQGHRPYDADDQSFIVDIAYRTALAIENCRLFDSLREEISRRQEAKEALDISEERFRATFEKTALGIKLLDTDGNILLTNPAFQRMTGYGEAELVGRHFQEFLYPEDARRASRMLRNLEFNPALPAHFEHRILRKDGTLIWASTIFTKIRNGGPENGSAFVAGIIEDVSARKRMEQEMAELHSRMRTGHELERLRLAQELHDGPMQELYSAIYQIEDLRGKATPEMDEPLGAIGSEIQAVVQSLRNTATELRPPTLSAFGLERAIRSHAEDFQEKYPKIQVELSLAEDRQLLPEEVRLALFRVVQHALSNVARHSEATNVRIRFTFDAEEVFLEISDNGIGFDVPANMIKFLRAGHYGLAGAQERVAALAGTLNVESEPGRGTAIRAAIPWGQTGN